MTISDILHGFVRRWYIVGPGLILAIALSISAWIVVPQQFERSASILLLPGTGSLPGPTANPYLFLGGMTASADVLVGAAGAESNLREIIDEYPAAEMVVERDAAVAGPVIRLTATATSDEDASTIVDLLIQTTARTLDDIQQQQNIPEANRISMTTLSVDDKGTTQQRTRVTATVAVGAVTALSALLLAALVDGIARRRRRMPLTGRGSALSGLPEPLEGADVGTGERSEPASDFPLEAPAASVPSLGDLDEIDRASMESDPAAEDKSDDPRRRKRSRP